MVVLWEWALGNFEDEHGEGLEGRGVEESGGQGGFGGGEEVGQTLEHRHLVDELVYVWNVVFGGKPDSDENGVSNWVFRRRGGWGWGGGCHF